MGTVGVIGKGREDEGMEERKQQYKKEGID